MIKHLISYIYIIQAEANDDGLSQIQESGDMLNEEAYLYIFRIINHRCGDIF
ncbi:hypothetical protein CCDG5_0322 [[Clostridium] cellulosi]|uniref:Uncharacterized protein n=1 Tax=[Clostridium] cellulosi TaxID=29343 RepID=A0A078KQR9_9FIRM|nr:hypothetical protein CCDG5_0322 [[Clostridium] cellulosi]